MTKIAFILFLAFFLSSTVIEASPSSQVMISENSIVEVEHSTSENSDTKLFVVTSQLFDCSCHREENIPYDTVSYTYNPLDRNFRPPIS
ncbi:MAG: hypothetical protein OEW60_03590 [Thiovulaceae bacterium]|nr:hypothetical protein [Sulfurimonadaceae bacterium]